MRTYILLILISCTAGLFATPETGSMVRHILLGTNAENYFTMKFVSHNPGSHYERLDSTYVCQFDLETNTLIDQELISASHFSKYPDENNTPQRKMSSSIPAFDFNVYLQENGVYSFQPGEVKALTQYDIGVDKNGIYLLKDQEYATVMKSDVLQDLLDLHTSVEYKILSVQRDGRIAQMLPGTDTYVFVSLSYAHPDTGYQQEKTVALSRSKLFEEVWVERDNAVKP